MPDRTMLYRILYALTASNGREAALFGSCSSVALEAFEQSLPCGAFPELWFELPLLGDPWLDLHALTARTDLDPSMSFDASTTGGCPEAFAWFAAKEQGVRQLALSWDTSTGKAEHPAVQLLVNTKDSKVTCDFLVAAGRGDAVPAYQSFIARMPQRWFACYTGVFPGRPGHHLRVECIPDVMLQQAYASDAALLEKHLRQVGLTEFGETVISRCQYMASMPFQFEFQFDVTPEGAADSTLGASLRFAHPSTAGEAHVYDSQGAAGELMETIESWGLADERWRLLADTAFATSATFKGQGGTLWCYPTFVKLRWRGGEPLDAKAYLLAGVQ